MRKSVQLIASMLMLFSLNSFAQDCKYDIQEKDKFTGKSKVSYWYQLGTEIIYFHKLEGKYTIEIATSMSGVMKQGVEKGAIGQFRLADGTMVSFTCMENAEPTSDVTGSTITTKIRVFYEITPEELAKMAASPPVAMKVQLGSKEVVKEFNEKKGGKIQNAARCLIQFKE